VRQKDLGNLCAQNIAMSGDPEDWEQLETDGDIYYHNKRSHATVWSKPDCLLTEAERAEMSAEWVWVKHRHDAWVPARVESKGSDGSMDVTERETKKRRQLSADKIGPPIPNIRDLITMTSDLVQMAHVNESSIIDLLKRRFKRDKCYTAIGDILIAVNPFKRLPHFTPQEIEMYRGRGTKDMQPHPYLIIDGAYNDVCTLKTNQSVLISGESGAGKTFTVKVLLGYLAEVAGSPTQVEQKILAANPVLEAFGNAKTLRNDNSSRFGKFIEIQFERNRHQIVGCHTINYLLEKSRISNQGPGERNFHIFYYMCDPDCLSEEERSALELGNIEEYNFASGGKCFKARTHNDHDEYSDMEEGFKNLGFTADQRRSCLEITAAVLHLGQVEFEDEGSSGSKPTSSSGAVIDTIARLLGVPSTGLAKGLTELVTEQFTRAFSPAKASETRDSLCKAVYSAVFDWLVKRCNHAMKKSDDAVETDFIGMLDIFGFEIFKKNGFEQLCINFANEKLQQMFNKHTFLLEEETYEREGVPFDHVTFYDSQPMLTFLGLPAKGRPKGGLFGILDEQTAVQSTDTKFLNQLKSKYGKGGKKHAKGLFSDRVKARDGFKISHYAGDVIYCVKDFIQKNADKLEANLSVLLSESSKPLLAELFAVKTKKSGKGTKTQGGYFMGQLRKLEQTVDATWPRFIRCVKPNQQKIPDEFDAPLSLEQLRFAGVFEAVEIRKQGYPYRKIHEHFFKDYRLLMPKAQRPAIKQPDYGATCRKMIPILIKEIPEAKKLNMGTSMVLYKSPEHRVLELKRLQVLNYYCSACQCSYKGKYARRLYARLKPLRPILEAAISSRSIPTLDAALAKVAGESFKMYCHTMAEIVRGVLIAEEKLKVEIQTLLKKDAEEHYKAYTGMVEQMDRWISKDPLAFQDSNSKEVRKKHRQVLLRRETIAAIKAAIEKVVGSDVAAALDAIDAALAKCAAAKAEVGFSFCPDEESACTTKQGELRQEKAALATLTTAMESGKPRGTKRQLDVSGMNKSTLVSAVRALEALPPQCVDAIAAIPIGAALRDLRAATIVAASNPEAKADSPEWQEVESCLSRCANAGLGETDEIVLVRGALAMRAAVEKVVEKINAGVAVRDDGLMSTALGQADELELDTHPDKSIASAVISAKSLLAEIVEAKAVLTEGTSRVNEASLARGLALAEACQYNASGMAGEGLCATSSELLDWVINVTDLASEALELQYAGLISAALHAADEIHLSTPEIEDLRDLMQLDFRAKKTKEKECALAAEDHARAVRIELEIQADIFSSAAAMSDFELSNYEKLKSTEVFCKRTMLRIGFSTFNANSENMLHWVRHSLHTSLSIIDGPTGCDEQEVARLHKMAKNLFKDVMGIMKDRRTDYPEAAAHELLDEGRGFDQLGDEIFMQLMKQLTPDTTHNPSPGPSEEASDRGWLMLAMCCATYAPSEDFRPFLERFLRHHGKDVHVHLMHMTLHGGPLEATPEPEKL
jgi:hypothetical protein